MPKRLNLDISRLVTNPKGHKRKHIRSLYLSPRSTVHAKPANPFHPLRARHFPLAFFIRTNRHSPLQLIKIMCLTEIRPKLRERILLKLPPQILGILVIIIPRHLRYFRHLHLGERLGRVRIVVLAALPTKKQSEHNRSVHDHIGTNPRSRIVTILNHVRRLHTGQKRERLLKRRRRIKLELRASIHRRRRIICYSIGPPNTGPPSIKDVQDLLRKMQLHPITLPLIHHSQKLLDVSPKTHNVLKNTVANAGLCRPTPNQIQRKLSRTLYTGNSINRRREPNPKRITNHRRSPNCPYPNYYPRPICYGHAASCVSVRNVYLPLDEHSVPQARVDHTPIGIVDEFGSNLYGQVGIPL